jgi:hypothetical protein
MGTDLPVLIPSLVAAEFLAVLNDNPSFFFWSGQGARKSICGNWGKRIIVLCFDEAKLTGGHIRAPRLRNTFACEFLTAGV